MRFLISMIFKESNMYRPIWISAKVTNRFGIFFQASTLSKQVSQRKFLFQKILSIISSGFFTQLKHFIEITRFQWKPMLTVVRSRRRKMMMVKSQSLLIKLNNTQRFQGVQALWLMAKRVAGFPSRNSNHRGVYPVKHDRIYCFYLLTDYFL